MRVASQVLRIIHVVSILAVIGIVARFIFDVSTVFWGEVGV